MVSASQYGPFKPWIIGELAYVAGRQGRLVEGLAMIDSFREADANSDSWCTPELLRNEGRLLALHGKGDQALKAFDSAIALSIRQGAHAWRARAERDREVFSIYFR